VKELSRGAPLGKQRKKKKKEEKCKMLATKIQLALKVAIKRGGRAETNALNLSALVAVCSSIHCTDRLHYIALPCIEMGLFLIGRRALEVRRRRCGGIRSGSGTERGSGSARLSGPFSAGGTQSRSAAGCFQSDEQTKGTRKGWANQTV